MKKNLLSSFVALVVIFNVALVSLSTKTYALVEPATCKVEVIDCPGWGTGDRQVCHQNGDGLVCNCGASTACP